MKEAHGSCCPQVACAASSVCCFYHVGMERLGWFVKWKAWLEPGEEMDTEMSVHKGSSLPFPCQLESVFRGP